MAPTAPPPAPPPPPSGPAADFEREALVHLDAVHRFARSLTQDVTAAEDLTQETFLRACRHWDQFRPGTNCRAWLFTICRNLHYRQGERRSREEPTDAAELESLAAGDLYASLPGEFARGELFETPDVADAIRAALAALPEEFRSVVTLSDVEDLSYEMIAGILDLPLGTVKSRLFRGRRLLQESLIEHARDAGIVPRAGEGR